MAGRGRRSRSPHSIYIFLPASYCTHRAFIPHRAHTRRYGRDPESRGPARVLWKRYVQHLHPRGAVYQHRVEWRIWRAGYPVPARSGGCSVSARKVAECGGAGADPQRPVLARQAVTPPSCPHSTSHIPHPTAHMPNPMSGSHHEPCYEPAVHGAKWGRTLCTRLRRPTLTCQGERIEELFFIMDVLFITFIVLGAESVNASVRAWARAGQMSLKSAGEGCVDPSDPRELEKRHIQATLPIVPLP